MSGKPTVSVAMATYNGARFLQAQLDSLAGQTLLPAELVVGDDGSTDGTLDILEAFARAAPFPVQVHRNETRLDYGDNFMRAAMRCSGDYLAFCDQDDVWVPEKIERGVAAMAAPDTVLCAHVAVSVDAELRELEPVSLGVIPGTHAPLTLNPAGLFLGFTLMVRADILRLASLEERPDDLFRPGKRLAHDRWAYFLGSTFGAAVYLDAPLALYRQHGQNTFGADKGMSWDILRERVRLAAAEQAHQKVISWQKADLLAAIATRTEGETALRAKAGAAYWQRMAAIYGRREQIATAPSLAGRLSALAGMALAGGYRPFARGGLTGRALAKDLFVAFAPRRGPRLAGRVR
jgi:glycosyltransferase involved in cell wall biosynthesis